MVKNCKYLIIAVIYAFIKSWQLISSYPQNVSITTCIISMGFNRPHFIPSYLTLLLGDLVPSIIFQVFFGIYIYRHFCVANVYYFSRQCNRVYWYMREVLKLLTYVIIYFCLYIGTSIGIINIIGYAYSDACTIATLFYVLIYQILFTFAFTLLINIVSLFLGSSSGFMVIYAVQTFFVFSLALYDKLLPLKGIWGVLFKMNPIANLVFTWHSSNNQIFNKNINMLNINFSLNSSIMYFIIINIMTIVIGAWLIKKTDISLENKEVQG
jgi:hypothetical protein